MKGWFEPHLLGAVGHYYDDALVAGTSVCKRAPGLLASVALQESEPGRPCGSCLRYVEKIKINERIGGVEGPSSAPEKTFDELIAASSFGTVGAQAVRERAPKGMVAKIMARVAELDAVERANASGTPPRPSGGEEAKKRN